MTTLLHIVDRIAIAGFAALVLVAIAVRLVRG